MTRAAPQRPRRPRTRAAAGALEPRWLAGEPLPAALAYAVAGWPVVPLHTPTSTGGCSCGRAACASAGKHPRTRHGFRDASTDPARITAWWRRWPDANVGVRTGELVVLDVDGPAGARALAELEDRARAAAGHAARTHRPRRAPVLPRRRPRGRQLGRPAGRGP